MKKHEFKNFLALLAKSRKLLVYDDGLLLKEYKSILESFDSYLYNSVNETTIENVREVLVSTDIDIALVYSKHPKDVLKICNDIAETDPDIVITAILEERESATCKRIMNIVDTVVSAPFDTEILTKKLGTALAAKLMIYELTHTLNTHKKFMDDTGIDSYRDTYLEDVNIIIDHFSILVERLESGELGEEFFLEIANEIELVSKIFNYHHYTAHLSSIFDELSAFLRTYSFDDVDVSTLEGFDYLTEIVKDIRNYLDNFFVKRIFSDVYVFEHSLHDCIVFMINHLIRHKNKVNDVEFF
jgi:hypothetical protein